MESKALTEKGLIKEIKVHGDWILCEVPKVQTKVEGTTLDLELPKDIIAQKENELSSRWLYKVIGVGHLCTNVRVGDKVFIPHAALNFVDPMSKELVFLKEQDVMGSIQAEEFDLPIPISGLKLFTKEEAIEAAKGKSFLEIHSNE